MIKIDIDTRCWKIPKEECFLGVESDDKVRILQFELSKNEFCDGLNFTDCNCFINYKNEGNDTIPYGITDMKVQEDGTVTFTWEVSRGATIFKGNTFAVLCAKKVREDGTITNEWNSRIGSFIVAKGLEPLSSITEVPEIDIISQLLLVAQQANTNAKNNIDKSSSLLEKAEGLGYLKEEYDVLEARMNQFTSLQEGSTTGDAELIDGRIGYDGKVYDNIGGAIREQVSKLNGDLAELGHTSKNLLRCTDYEITTENSGVTFSMDADGKIHLNGNATDGNFIVKVNCEELSLVGGNAYSVNASAILGNISASFRRKVAVSGAFQEVSTNETFKTWTATECIITNIVITLTSGYRGNFDGYLWVTEGSVATEYEPKGFVSDVARKSYVIDLHNEIESVQNEIDNIRSGNADYCGLMIDNGFYAHAEFDSVASPLVSYVADRSFDRYGYKSVKITVPNGTSANYYNCQMALPKAEFDYVSVLMFVPVATFNNKNTLQFYIQLASSKARNKYASAMFVDSSLLNVGWCFYKIPISKFTFANGSTIADMDLFRLRLRTTATTTEDISIIVNGFVFDDAMMPTVVMSFDGIYDTDVVTGGKFESLINNGIHATMFTSVNTVFSDETKAIFASHVVNGEFEQQMYATANRDYVQTEENPVRQYAELITQKDWVYNNSLCGVPTKYAAPNGILPNTTMVMLKKLGFNMTRSNSCYFISKFTKKEMNVGFKGIFGTNTASTIKALIDEAIEQKKSLFLFTHEVKNSPTSYDSGIANFAEVCDYIGQKIASGELQSMNFSEFYDACVN